MVGVTGDTFHPPGGAPEPWTERIRHGEQSGGEHPELSPTSPLCSRGAGAGGPGLYPVRGPGGSEQVQGVGENRNEPPSLISLQSVALLLWTLFVFLKTCQDVELQAKVLICSVLWLLCSSIELQTVETNSDKYPLSLQGRGWMKPPSPFLNFCKHLLCENNSLVSCIVAIILLQCKFSS